MSCCRLHLTLTPGKYEFPPDKFDAISAEARDLVTKLLYADVVQRPNCMQALDHAWFKAATTGAVIQVCFVVCVCVLFFTDNWRAAQVYNVAAVPEHR